MLPQVSVSVVVTIVVEGMAFVQGLLVTVELAEVLFEQVLSS